MHRTQIYLPKTQITYLKEAARNGDTTMSDVVRLLVQTHIVEPRRKKTRSLVKGRTFYYEARGVLKNIERTGESGPTDLAERIDDYLYGTI